ncbi:hypothetical protein ELQ87_16595 [Streptomyces griseoviridis]|uniref:Uncharacterized protein n=1 Tax=Streptomyces griseoviridis TaxID=45398 RepID=A0A3Q9KTK0_STRGD|nr:hypothetical protein [Streptomyces griseoviridis]AZS85740.1 hypothetical protein ELQ87_16595 [Streptomyces griseoviridis]QCN87410.1 hypothetical protein DDJ31_22685 [Streptomyces griseoviridis]
MSDQKGLEFGKFMGDDGGVHDMISASVIIGVPAARGAAERYGRELRFDFLDDEAVHRLLFHRWEDNATGRLMGCLGSIPLFVFGAGAWPFWDLVASQKSTAFQAAFIVVDTLIVVGVLVGLYMWRRSSLLDPATRNMRIRVRRYHKIARIARRGGADIPAAYPYYGMYLSSRKFFPDAPELSIPDEGKIA